ncbi:CACTA en-spm transposon protein [Cucumis melo var. makuwa]|uniref:CACTA en-spm transposon protein n=1 Tax=Cucumis melo var. makuwa TaxID=1194695 RepID=A0A5A7TL03_CUCMM|nr:CACTA en-spm transposon protein [Cucumis melo var. makuwa]
MITSRMTLCAGLTLISQSLKDRLCVMSLTTSSTLWMNTCDMQVTTRNYSDKPRIMSYQRNNFLETDAMFLEFEDDLDNLAGGSSSVRDNAAGSSSQPPATPTPRRRAQSRLLELEYHVAVNGCIPIKIAPRAEKPIYIEVVKGNLQRFFVFDFNDQAMNWSNHGRTRLLDRSSLTMIVAGQNRFYNDNTSSLRKKGSWSTVWSCFEKHTFVSQAADDAHFQPTPEGSQPLSRDEICDQVLGRRSSYSKGFGWGSKPKARKTTGASNSTTSCSQSVTERDIQIQAKFDQALERIELQDRNYQALASEMEQM